MGDRLTVINGETVLVPDKSEPVIREHRKLLHEEAFDRFKINEDDVKKEIKVVKVFPSDWLVEFIKFNTDQVESIKPEVIKPGFRSFIIQFSESGDAEEFEKIFKQNLFKNINKFIQNKELNPKDYNRSLILGFQTNDFQLIITY